jgi:hypothetical protein
MNDTLNKITEIIDRYESGEWLSAENLRGLLRELSTNYYRLTQFNIEFAQDFNREVYRFKGTNAAANAYAEISVPGLRVTRKILLATGKVLDSMRSEIGILRNES